MKKNSNFEKLLDQPLTEMQKKFARLYVDSLYGTESLTNTECAVKAGYSPESAYQRAYELLSPKFCPHVVKFISELKEDFRIRNSIDPDKHMAELNNIKRLAIKKGHLSTAGRMEELRGKVAGYYVDRLLTKQSSDKDQTLEQLEMKLQNLLQEWNVIAPNEELTFGGKKNGKK
tara:strand:+ start:300 stop:821 length:522 start_codon:yes stop_codon:yes gene_type:complete